MRRREFVVSIVVVAVAVGAWTGPVAAARSQARAVRVTPRWKAGGPQGGQVLDVTSVPGHPDTLYAALGQGGVFRSVNGGLKWTHAGLSGFDIVDVAVSSDGTLFAASETPSRIFRKVKGSNKWTGLNPGSDEFLAVAVSPSNPDIVYLAGDNGTTFRSTDGGATWHQRGTHASSAIGITVDPATPGTAYVAGEDDTYKTTNGGATWKPLHVPSITDHTVAIAPTNPQRIYVAATHGVYRSTDGGTTWKQLGAAKITGASVVGFVPGHPGTLFAGRDSLFRSTNAGSSWTEVLPGGTEGLRLAALDVISGSEVVTGGEILGMFRSGDGGDTWKHSNAGLAATQIDVVAVSPASKVFAVGSGHMFQSTDAGVTWSVDQTGPDDAAAIAFDPSDAQTAYAGTFFEGVMKTTDGGAHWNQVDGNHGYSLGIAVEPNDTQSVDAGADVTVRRSVNGGGTWNPTGAIGFQVHQIAFSNEQNPVTLVATSGGVFQSTNDGAVWHQRSDGGTGSVSFDPLHPLIAYAAGFDQPHVMKSVDGGHTWNPSDTGLGPKDYVTTMVVDPAHPTTLYVGTQGAGVFRSTDSGGHWSAFNAGLFNKTVTSLAISSTGTTLFAATTGNGVFVIHLP